MSDISNLTNLQRTHTYIYISKFSKKLLDYLILLILPSDP